MSRVQSHFFKTVYARQNYLTTTIFKLAMAFSSYPRLLLEVFTRKNFGRRYFSMASVFSVAVILFFIPLAGQKLQQFMFPIYYGRYGNDDTSSWVSYIGWYILLAGFLLRSFWHFKEQYVRPAEFDFTHFSLSAGRPIRFSEDLKFGSWKPNIRQLEIYVEPIIIFILGYVLSKIGQHVGGLLMFCAVLYGLSFAGRYKEGDDYLMDLIDQGILDGDIRNTFVQDIEYSDSGVRYYMRKPSSKELRESLAHAMVSDMEDPVLAI